MKKFICILLTTLSSQLSAFSSQLSAPTSPLSAFSSQLSANNTIDILYSGTKATVTIPDGLDVTATVTGANVTLTSNTESEEYTYRVKGTTTNGRLYISGDYKMTLLLDGVSIKNTSGAALTVACGKRIAVQLANGTDNYLEDSPGGTQKAAMYFSGHPEFDGKGTLTVVAHTAHAICAKEYLEVKDGTINVLGAVKDGIHCGKGKAQNANNYFRLKDGSVNISSVGGDCIDSDDYGTVRIEGGRLNMSVSADGGRGIKCDSLFTMSGGTIDAQLTGGTFIDTSSAIPDTSRCMALNVGHDLLMSGGTVNISRLNDESKGYKVKGAISLSSDAVINQTGSHFLVNPALYQYDMSIYAQVAIDGVPVSDYANYQLAALHSGQTRASATITTLRDTHSYALLRTYSNQASETAIGFRLFDASTGQEHKATQTVTFTSDAQIGTPGTPLLLSFHTGDVNADGHTDIADLAALIRLLLLSPSTPCPAADFNGNDNLDSTDLLLLRQRVLGVD